MRGNVPAWTLKVGSQTALKTNNLASGSRSVRRAKRCIAWVRIRPQTAPQIARVFAIAASNDNLIWSDGFHNKSVKPWGMMLKRNIPKVSVSPAECRATVLRFHCHDFLGRSVVAKISHSELLDKVRFRFSFFFSFPSVFFFFFFYLRSKDKQIRPRTPIGKLQVTRNWVEPCVFKTQTVFVFIIPGFSKEPACSRHYFQRTNTAADRFDYMNPSGKSWRVTPSNVAVRDMINGILSPHTTRVI